MKTKLIQKIKEESLKKIAKVIESWFKLDIGFAQAHKEIGDVIEKAISQSEEELVEEIKKKVENFIEDQLYREVEPISILNKIPKLICFILENLNKK